MTYTNSIPIAGESLGSTRDRVRGNFEEIAAVEAINHIAFNAVGKGKHKYLQMPEVTASGVGVPVTLPNEGGLYVDVGPNPAQANLFFRAENNGFNYQLTKTIAASSALFGVNINNYNAVGVNFTGGWTFLPGGLLLQYGLAINLPANGTKTVTFPVAFTTACFSISLSPVTSNNPTSQLILNANPGLTSFVINNNSSTFNRAFWIAIGL